MFVHGFRSKHGAELRVYTIELVMHETVDEELDIPLSVPRYLVLAALRSMRTPGGYENHRGSMTFDIEKGYELSSHWGIGAFREDEVEEINSWVKANGKVLVSWLKKCPVKPTRGRSLFTPSA